MDTDIYPIMPEFYHECIAITEQYEKLWGRWSDDSQLLHIITEVTELKDVLRNKNQKYGNPESEAYREKLLDELADVFLTAFSTANYLGINHTWLDTAIITKLRVVEHRLQTIQGERQEK